MVAIGLGILTLLGVGGFFVFRSQPLSVAVTPGATTLWAAQRQEFKAEFSDGKNHEVQWSVSPDVGSISPEGVYAAPPSVDSDYTLQVTARSLGRLQVSASATILLQKSKSDSETQPTKVQPELVITLEPSSASLWASERQRFRVRITGSPDTAVTWSVDPWVGTVSANGLYTAPRRTMATRYVRIVATSRADSTKSAIAIVTLKPSIASQ